MAILDLQSNLNSEIQAKESIRKELSTAKAVQVSLEKWAADFLCHVLLSVDFVVNFFSNVKLSQLLVDLADFYQWEVYP